MSETSLNFFVNDSEVRLPSCSPTTTLLDYLRLQMTLTGSKEGCAEGDCGACTVVLAAWEDEQLVLRSVNSCILFLPMLHGKWVITIDYLAQSADQLHLLQQAFVDQHASQCGFCTPGFIMALYPLYAQGDWQPGDDCALEDAIAGNLCRCTGYRPIIAAAQSALQVSKRSSDHIVSSLAAMGAKLRQISPGSICLSSSDGQQMGWCPASLTELLSLRAQHPEAVLVAGATDVGLWVTKQRRVLAKTIFLASVHELDYIEADSQALTIGANVSYDQAHEAINTYFPALGQLYYRIGATQVRNSGTVVGNIANASPIGDGPPCYLALGASIELSSSTAKRQLALEQFFIDYQKTALQADEVVTSLRLPALAADCHFRAYKISKRFDQDISSVLMACWWQQQGDNISAIRIAFGGMAAIPKRAYQLERWLCGRALASMQASAEVRQNLQLDFSPLSDMRASAAYRMQVAVNLVAKIYLEREQSGSQQLYQLARDPQWARQLLPS